VATTKLRPRVGPRPLMVAGMVLGAIGMLILRGIGLDSSYAGVVLPGLIVMGMGLGLVFSTALNSATLGVTQSDAGVASATVNAAQQVGASLGTALLSTLAASATASFLAGHRPTPLSVARGAIHGYTTAFTVSAGVFAVAAMIAAVMFAPEQDQPSAAGEAVAAV
jgi:MFS family permease